MAPTWKVLKNSIFPTDISWKKCSNNFINIMKKHKEEYIGFYIEAIHYPGYWWQNGYYKFDLYILYSNQVIFYKDLSSWFNSSIQISLEDYVIEAKVKNLPELPLDKPKTIREQLEIIEDCKVEGDDKTCSICMANKPCIAFGCGHNITCSRCSLIIYKSDKKCPECRVEIKSILRVY